MWTGVDRCHLESDGFSPPLIMQAICTWMFHGKPLLTVYFGLAGKLGYDEELFLIDVKRVDIPFVPLFYRSMLEAVQAVSVHLDTRDFSLPMFFNEPIFLNPIF